jgi:hypothetical protein
MKMNGAELRCLSLAQGKIIRQTPRTITGDKQALYSYAKCIARKTGDGWIVVAPSNHLGAQPSVADGSRTTNIHCRAARQALESTGETVVVLPYETRIEVEGWGSLGEEKTR